MIRDITKVRWQGNTTKEADCNYKSKIYAIKP